MTPRLAITLQDPEPEAGSRTEVGMRASPEVVLLVGGAVLTVALTAVLVPFLVRAWREDAARRQEGGGR